MKLSLLPDVLAASTSFATLSAREEDSTLPLGLALCGSLPILQQLRLQVQIVSRHLRTAVLEIEPGLDDQAIAAEIADHHVESDRPMLLLRATALNAAVADGGLSGARHLLDTAAGVVYLTELSLLSPAAQRVLVQLLSASSGGQRWIFSTRISLRTLRVRGLLQPELLRCLSTITLRVPCLRERLDDLPELAGHLLAAIAEQRNVHPPALSPAAIAHLRSHPWTNNLVELNRVLRASTLEHPGAILDASHLRPHLEAELSQPAEEVCLEPWPMHHAAGLQHAVSPAPSVTEPPATEPATRSMRLEDVVDQHLLYVMERCGGNKLRAAEILHISRSTLYRMLEAIAKRQPTLPCQA